MFQNREEAGERLAARFAGIPLRDPVVMGLPRGGIVVGAVLARRLGAPFDLMLARKLAVPGLEGRIAGVVGEDGAMLLYPGEGVAGDAALAAEAARLRHEMAQRRQRLRAIVPPEPVAGRSVVLVDDALASGSTVVAALRALRPRGPAEIYVAVPVASSDGLAAVAGDCDRVICLKAHELFSGVGRYYNENPPLDDAALLRVLRGTRLPQLLTPAPRPGQDEPLRMYTVHDGAASE